MEQIYPQYQDTCELVKTSQEKVAFILNYSRSLNYVKHKKLIFENNLN